jgi:glycosyltransferase involved in cell wall biosynthesis
MKTKIISKQDEDTEQNRERLFSTASTHGPGKRSLQANILSEILFISSYPPRECGIATYSQDLIKSLYNKFSNTFSIRVCALESSDVSYKYPPEVKYTLKTYLSEDYEKLAEKINKDDQIKIVLLQHEFGFYSQQEKAFLTLLNMISKPVMIVFHTVLPSPDEKLKTLVSRIASVCDSIIVMTNNSVNILISDYGVAQEKISMIAHGTHLVTHINKDFLKNKYGLRGRNVLTTFGLLSSGKSIETTLKALPEIIKTNPDVIFLIIGKTHPEVLKQEGEAYRLSLEKIVSEDNLTKNVLFVNSYVTLPDLLEYLQLTDIYLFTTKDPNQAVSGTFAYAMSCGCPIISTPIPHAKEVLTEDTGIIFDFQNADQLATAVIKLLNDNLLRRSIRINTLQKIVSTAWENSAVKHTMLFNKIAHENIPVRYSLPALNLQHIKHMTTETGIIQFSKVNQPDLCSGYTLDDNSRAAVVMCMHFGITHESKSIWYLNRYLNFIKLCQQPEGDFLNYVDVEKKFTSQNSSVNLDDANGRAIWALGYLISEKDELPDKMVSEAEELFRKAIPHIESIRSTRAMAFIIKGLYYFNKAEKSSENILLVKTLATRLANMYKHESNEKWKWFEDYLTYANSILPEAMLYAWLMTGEDEFKTIATSSLNFLNSIIFNESGIEVVSNRTWLKKGQPMSHYGEQPIDVGYTIMTLSKFYDVFANEDYMLKMETAFNWFLGNNRLNQVIYNPCTGGCYDGLEETHVNLNQGAESSLSYLMARLTVEKYVSHVKSPFSAGFADKKLYREKAFGMTSRDSVITINYFIADESGKIQKKSKKQKLVNSYGLIQDKQNASTNNEKGK